MKDCYGYHGLAQNAIAGGGLRSPARGAFLLGDNLRGLKNSSTIRMSEGAVLFGVRHQ